MKNLAEERYDAVAAAAQQSYEDRQLADYRIESAAWESVQPALVDQAEAVTLDHIINLKKMGKLTRRMARVEKQLKRDQADWAEYDSNLGQ